MRSRRRIRRGRAAGWCLAIAGTLLLIPGCRSPLDVASGEGHLREARSHLRAGKAVFARAEYARAKQEQPDNAKLMRRFGDLFASFGKWQDSTRAYEESLDVELDAQTAVALAGAYWTAAPYGIDSHAHLIERALKRALAKDPNHPEALNSLAYLYAEQGKRLDYALRLSRKSIRLSPTTPAYLDTLGWIHYKAGRPGKALPLLSQAVELNWQNYELREHLAACFEALGDTKRARIERRKAEFLSGTAPARRTPSETRPGPRRRA